MVDIRIGKTNLDEISNFRALFLEENNFQFVCNKCHDYGWSDDYLFTINGEKAGYGCVWGTNRREDRDAIFEFYLLPAYRSLAELVFPKFHELSGTIYVECQTNDLLLTSMLYEFCCDINTEAILFEEYHETNMHIPGTIFRKKKAGDTVSEDTGEYLLFYNGEVVADGGLMLNYNLPYADIYMRVYEDKRRNGFGSLIVQELKKEAYRIGRVPAARCNINNFISKATLEKAGLRVCGYRVMGKIKLDGK